MNHSMSFYGITTQIYIDPIKNNTYWFEWLAETFREKLSLSESDHKNKIQTIYLNKTKTLLQIWKFYEQIFFYQIHCVFVARHRALTNPIRVDYLMVSDEFYLLYALKWTFQNGQIICQKSPTTGGLCSENSIKTPAVAFGNWKGFILLIRKQELLKARVVGIKSFSQCQKMWLIARKVIKLIDHNLLNFAKSKFIFPVLTFAMALSTISMSHSQKRVFPFFCP